MGVINKEDIVGYYVGDEREETLLCPDCFGEEKSLKGVRVEYLLEQNVSSEKIYTCDNCKELIAK